MAALGNIASSDVLVWLDREQHMAYVRKSNARVISAEDEVRWVIRRVALRGLVEAGVGAFRQKDMVDMPIARAVQGFGNRVHNDENILRIEGVPEDRIRSICGRSYGITPIGRVAQVLVC